MSTSVLDLPLVSCFRFTWTWGKSRIRDFESWHPNLLSMKNDKIPLKSTF